MPLNLCVCVFLLMKFCVFQTLKEFRDDELHHHDIGLENDAEKVNTLRSQQAKLELSEDLTIAPLQCYLRIWFDFCFTALQHILGHFGHGQLT